MLKYPKVIYIQSQGSDSDNDKYFQAETNFENIPDDGKVAVYKLVEIKELKTSVSLN